MIRLSVTCGDPAGALRALNQCNVVVHNVQIDPDELTLHVVIYRQDLCAVRKMAKKKGYDLQVKDHLGLHWRIRGLLKRPVLIIGMAFLLFLTLMLPTRALFFRVEGNEKVPTKLILEKSADAGIRFGSSCRQIRSEKVKNELLGNLDGLQWVGINTQGCVVTIIVRERSSAAMQPSPRNEVRSIVAKMDGEILSCTATSGSLKCQVGQIVQKGEVLISGYTDCGIAIRATTAQGEILARTSRYLEAVTLSNGTRRTEKTEIQEKYALRIGKKRINFYKGSGISGTICDKIYEENYITLPGGFSLPVAVIKETWIYAELEQVDVEQSMLKQCLIDFATWYLPSQMTAGSVQEANQQVYFEEGIAIMQGNYTCAEEIGQGKNEEIVTPYGNDQ